MIVSWISSLPLPPFPHLLTIQKLQFLGAIPGLLLFCHIKLTLTSIPKYQSWSHLFQLIKVEQVVDILSNTCHQRTRPTPPPHLLTPFSPHPSYQSSPFLWLTIPFPAHQCGWRSSCWSHTCQGSRSPPITTPQPPNLPCHNCPSWAGYATVSTHITPLLSISEYKCWALLPLWVHQCGWRSSWWNCTCLAEADPETKMRWAKINFIKLNAPIARA